MLYGRTALNEELKHPPSLPLFYVGKADYFSDNTQTDNEFLSRGNLQFGGFGEEKWKIIYEQMNQI